MLTTVAALVIVLGLMVSLARRVRNTSAAELTQDLLRRLDGLMVQYQTRYHRLPAIDPLIDPASAADPDEQKLQRAALANNRELMAALRESSGSADQTFSGLSQAVYDESVLRDAWGTPIVYMSAMDPLIGTAPQNRRFFVSAGPDRQFLTQEDNLYSYEEGAAGLAAPPVPPPSTGHSE